MVPVWLSVDFGLRGIWAVEGLQKCKAAECMQQILMINAFSVVISTITKYCIVCLESESGLVAMQSWSDV